MATTALRWSPFVECRCYVGPGRTVGMFSSLRACCLNLKVLLVCVRRSMRSLSHPQSCTILLSNNVGSGRTGRTFILLGLGRVMGV